MKAYVKRLFAAAMAVVMLFAVAPFADVGFGSIFSTKASAMETVSGSYNQLVNAIYDYGDWDSYDDPYIWYEDNNGYYTYC